MNGSALDGGRDNFVTFLEVSGHRLCRSEGHAMVREMFFLRRAACFLIAGLFATSVHAQTPTPSPTPVKPVPNTTSLRGLVGTYPAGRSQVKIEPSSVYNGGSSLTATAPTDFSLKLGIDARVTVPTGKAAIKNSLTFSSTGTMRGRELAPGVTRHASFRGTYLVASPHRLDFLGTYKFGTATGTFSGFLQRNAKGRMFVVYSVFGEASTTPIYTYRYSATAPRK